MGRKHGFRGTPVKPSGTPSSVGGIFERRGDPLVSAREGREKFGRNLETENPAYDRYFAEDAAIQKALQNLKPKQVDTGNAFRKRIARDSNDPQFRASQILQNMNTRINREANKEIHIRPSHGLNIHCPWGCGFQARDSRAVSHHIHINPFKACLKKTGRE